MVVATKRGMDAVISKSASGGRRKPALKRKPGMNLVIAVGAPPKPREVEPDDEEMDESPAMEEQEDENEESYDEIVRRLDELSARLAAMEAKLDTM